MLVPISAFFQLHVFLLKTTKTFLGCKVYKMSSNSKSSVFLTKHHNIAQWLKVEALETRVKKMRISTCHRLWQ